MFFICRLKIKLHFFKKRQIAYMTAAGFAAIWALVANLLIWHKLKFEGYRSFFDYSDGFLGFSSSILVLAFICAYILKDRIKDLGRDKFQGGSLTISLTVRSRFLIKINILKRKLRLVRFMSRNSILIKASLFLMRFVTLELQS